MLRAFPGWHQGSPLAVSFGDLTSCVLLTHTEMPITFHSSVNPCLIPPVAVLPRPSENLGLSSQRAGILFEPRPISWPL